jgi:hypothetical protein
MDSQEYISPSPNGQYVFLTEIAEQLGMHRVHARKYALKHGFFFDRQRDPAKGNHLSLVLSIDDMQRLLTIRRTAGFPIGREQATTPVIPTDLGLFYLIQLVPDLSPLRLKLGFTDALPRRLSEYLTGNPTAQIYHSWPCRRVWEAAVIASVTRTGCRFIGGEVYDCDDLEAMRARVDAFFQVMPAA